MGTEQDIKAAIDELEQLHRRFGDVVQSSRDNWRQELIRLRRTLSDLVGRIVILLNDAECGEILAPGTRSEIRTRLSAFRAALADHQASWSAIAVEESDPEYRGSVETLRAASVEFSNYLRRVFE